MANSISELAGKPFPYTPTTIEHLLIEAAKANGNRIAVASLHQPHDLLSAAQDKSVAYFRWTYAELLAGARLLAASLQRKGLRKGDKIAVFIHNSAEWAVLFWASMLAGCALILVQPRVATNATELGHILKLTKPKAVVAWDVELVEHLQASASRAMRMIPVRLVCGATDAIPRPWMLFRSLFDARSSTGDIETPNVLSTADDPTIVLFTSGTTGLPKGCVHTNKTLTSMARNHADSLGLDHSASSVSHLSLAHCFGMLYSVSFWISGGKVVYPNGSYDAVSTLQALKQEDCSHMPAVPSLLYSLTDAAALDARDFASLRHVELSGTMASPEVMDLARTRLGARIVSVHYGMTESGPAVAWPSAQVHQSCEKDVVSPGFPVRGGMIRICAPGSRTPLPRGKLGEIHQSSPSLIASYLGAHEESAFYSDEAGSWYITGDQGVMLQSGEVCVTGRYKELIIRGGENVSPAQMETVLNCRKGLEVRLTYKSIRQVTDIAHRYVLLALLMICWVRSL